MGGRGGGEKAMMGCRYEGRGLQVVGKRLRRQLANRARERESRQANCYMNESFGPIPVN